MLLPPYSLQKDRYSLLHISPLVAGTLNYPLPDRRNYKIHIDDG
jgi:hypothetical protein